MAVETVVKNNTVILVGEVTSTAEINTEDVVREVIRKIGCNREELGFNAGTADSDRADGSPAESYEIFEQQTAAL